MAWNGKNTSILGTKPNVVADDISTATPTPAGASVASSSKHSDTKSVSKSATQTQPKEKSIPSTLPPASPAKNAWNGKNTKILGVKKSSDLSISAASIEGSTTQPPVGAVAVENIPIRSPTPATDASSTTSSITKNSNTAVVTKNMKELSVISSPSISKDTVSVTKSTKEGDETTIDSTADGSSSNVTSIDSNSSSSPPPSISEGSPTAVPSVVKNSNSNNNKNKASSSSSESKKKNKKNNNNSPPTSSVKVNRQQQQNGKNGKNNNKGGGQQQQKGGKNNQSNGKQQQSARGSGNSRSRKANNVGKVACSFFAKGMCTKGDACTFSHDPSLVSSAPPPPGKKHSNGNNSNNKSKKSMNVAAASFVPSKRVFDPHKAMAIKLAKEAQDQEDRSRFTSNVKIIKGEEEEKKSDDDKGDVVDPPFFSIDVECIATGYGSCANGINDGCGNEGRNKEGVPSSQYNDRSHRYPGRVAMVDSEGNLLTDIFIRPPKDGEGVTSYLTPLTGLTPELCLGSDAKTLDEAVEIIKSLLPKNGVLVGQAIDHDVEWLGLTPGIDFDRMLDISDIFRQRMPSILPEAAAVLKKKEEGGNSQPISEDKSSDEYLGFATRYRHFSLRHVCLNLLDEDIQSGVHNPITDAKYSLLLFHKYRNSSVTQLRIVRDGLHRAPVTKGFAAENGAVIEGVCVSAAGYKYKRAGRKILRWYLAKKKTKQEC